jgi:hypothetical protein
MAKSGEESSPKRVCVRLKTEDFPEQQYDVSFVSDNEKSDLDVIEDIIRRKSKRLFAKLSHNVMLQFHRPSDIVPGTWSVIGDDSPVKNRSQLLAVCTGSCNLNNNVASKRLSFDNPRAMSTPVAAAPDVGKTSHTCIGLQ